MTVEETNTSTLNDNTDYLVKLTKIGQPRYIRIVNSRTEIEIKNLEGVLETKVPYSDQTVWKLNN